MFALRHAAHWVDLGGDLFAPPAPSRASAIVILPSSIADWPLVCPQTLWGLHPVRRAVVLLDRKVLLGPRHHD